MKNGQVIQHSLKSCLYSTFGVQSRRLRVGLRSLVSFLLGFLVLSFLTRVRLLMMIKDKVNAGNGEKLKKMNFESRKSRCLGITSLRMKIAKHICG